MLFRSKVLVWSQFHSYTTESTIVLFLLLNRAGLYLGSLSPRATTVKLIAACNTLLFIEMHFFLLLLLNNNCTLLYSRFNEGTGRTITIPQFTQKHGPGNNLNLDFFVAQMKCPDSLAKQSRRANCLSLRHFGQ